MAKGKASEESLSKLHSALASALATRIADGTATAADLSVARQFLKDNGIDAIPVKGSPLSSLADQLPFSPEEDGAIGYE
jgi:hypothetical protein